MVCVKCSAAADLAEAARSSDLDPTDDVYDFYAPGTGYAGPAGVLINRAIDRLHSQCLGCTCQHEYWRRPATLITTASGRTMCTCHGPELPHRPHLCDAVADRTARHAARGSNPAVTAFNRGNTIGAIVRYWTGDRVGDGKISTTRTAAQLLGGHTPVVWVTGEASCIALTHVEPIPHQRLCG